MKPSAWTHDSSKAFDLCVYAGLPDLSGLGRPSAWWVFLQPVDGRDVPPLCLGGVRVSAWHRSACGAGVMVTASAAGVLPLCRVHLLPARSTWTCREEVVLMPRCLFLERALKAAKLNRVPDFNTWLFNCRKNNHSFLFQCYTLFWRSSSFLMMF